MKLRIDVWIRLLIVANILLVGGFLAVVALDSLHPSAPGHPVQSEAAASGSPDLMQMGLAHIPTSNACVLCHEKGGEAGLKPVPALGHPLEGWRQCLTCHTNDKLGRTAPGHTGIAQSECLNCHKEAKPGPAITQPHSRFQDQQCLDCHGKVAHLPSSMVGRNQTDCSLCHKPTASPPPSLPHVHDARLTCRECHQSPEVGNLPIDHALRSDSTCLLCHDIVRASPGPSAAAGATGSPKPSLRPGPTPSRTTGGGQGDSTRWPLLPALATPPATLRDD